jgi:type VI secretion system protein ImpF
MLGYGLPDYAAGTFNAMAEREALCKEVAATIGRFEPRLTQIRVTPRDRADTMEPVLRIRIEARLLAEDADEPVTFDALLDATTADMVVGPAANV